MLCMFCMTRSLQLADTERSFINYQYQHASVSTASCVSIVSKDLCRVVEFRHVAGVTHLRNVVRRDIQSYLRSVIVFFVYMLIGSATVSPLAQSKSSRTNEQMSTRGREVSVNVVTLVVGFCLNVKLCVTIKRSRLLESPVKSVQNIPNRRGRSGFNSQWKREFVKRLFKLVVFLLKCRNCHNLLLAACYI